MDSHPASEALPDPVNTSLSAALQRASGDNWFTVLAFGAAALALGYALQINNGNQHPKALHWLTVALFLCLSGILAARFNTLDKFKAQLLKFLLIAGFAFQISQLLETYTALSISVVYLFAALSAVVLLIAGTSQLTWVRHVGIALILTAHFALGLWTIRMSPDPHIDVYLFHRDALSSVIKGVNPYLNTIPNIYADNAVYVYGAGIVSNGRVNVGFPYPPLALLLTLPGHLIAGDYRYSLLAAITLSGALMAYAGSYRWGVLAAAVFLFTPRIFYVIELGWNEPLVVLLLTATVVCALRTPKYLPLPLGLLFAIKQYMLLAAPVTFLLLPHPASWREFTRLFLKAAAVAALVTLPAMLFNAHAFINDVLLFQFRQPFRMDALSYLSWWAESRGTRPPVWIGFAMLMPATALALWRAPRTPAGFVAAVAFIYLVFFAFSKQAFCNYYFFIVGAMCCAVATALPPPHTAVRHG